jgi:hypothetical protein
MAKLLACALFDVERARDERAHLCHHGTSQFEVYTLTGPQAQVPCVGAEV